MTTAMTTATIDILIIRILILIKYSSADDNSREHHRQHLAAQSAEPSGSWEGIFWVISINVHNYAFTHGNCAECN